ncbi:unnamed protein product, partial [Closterium sp. NIES-53]
MTVTDSIICENYATRSCVRACNKAGQATRTHATALPACRPALPVVPPCPSRAPPRPALRASLALARRPARRAVLACGRPIQFDTWLDELQLYLLSDSRDGVSLFVLTSGASLAPPDTADSATHSQWLTSDGGGGGGGGGGGSGGGSGGVGGGGGGGSGSGGGSRSGGGGSGGSRGGTDQRGGSGGDLAGHTCGKVGHTQSRCFSRLDDASRADCPYATELTCWLELLRQGVDIFALDYDAILAVMHAVTDSGEGDCYLSVPLDPGASHSFFHDSTTVTPLSTPVAVRLANISGGSVLANSSTKSRCVLIYTYTRTGRHLATFTCRPGSSLYTLTTEPPQVAASGQVSASGPVEAPYSCRLLTHQTLLWHHRLGHPSLPRLRGMHSRLLVSSVSMIHAAAPHFLWPFAVGYTAHQLNLWPRVSLPETLPTLHWTGEVGDASVFRVQGSRAFVCDTSADKLSSHAIPCVFLGIPPEAPGWQFYHPTTRCLLPSQDVIVAGGGLAKGVASGGAEPERAEPGSAEPGVAESEVAEPGGAALERAEPGVTESGGAEPRGVEPEAAEPGGNESGGAEPGGTVSAGGPTGASSRQEPLSPPQLCEWFAWCTRLRSGAAGAGGPAAGGTGAGGTGAAGPGGAGAAGPGGARTRGTGAAGAGGGAGAGARDPGAGGAEAGGTGGARAAGYGGARCGGTRPTDAGGAAGTRGARGAGGDGAAGCRGVRTRVAGAAGASGAGTGGARAVSFGGGGNVRPQPFLVPLLRHVLSLPSSTDLTPPLLCPPPDQSQPQVQPEFPLPAPSPYTEQLDSLIEWHEPESRPASPIRAVRTGRRVPCPRPPPVLATHGIALGPSSVPLRVPLPSPLASSLPDVPDPEFDLVRAASPTVTSLLAVVVTDTSFESTSASALVAELVEFAAPCRLDYTASFVAEYESDYPPFVEVECALGMDVLKDWPEEFECLAAAVKQPPGSPPVFKARYLAQGFSQRQGVEFFYTFSPTPKMTTLR